MLAREVTTYASEYRSKGLTIRAYEESQPPQTYVGLIKECESVAIITG